MQLAFNADMMFVLNNTDAPLYMRNGSNSAPSASYFDLYFPPVSYTILDPQGGWDYAGFLDNPSSDDCWVIFVFGYADEYRRTKELLGIWDWYLPNFDFSLYPASMYEWFFDFTPPAPQAWCYNFDFTDGDTEGWSPVGDAFSIFNEVLGVGFTGTSGLAGFGIAGIDISIPTPNYITDVEFDCVITNNAAAGSYDFNGTGGYVNGLLVPSFALTGIPGTPGSGTYNVTTSGTANNNIDIMRISMRTFTNRTITIAGITVRFFGIPFLTPNC